MNVEYLNSFIEAGQTVLKQTAGIDVKVGKVSLKTSPYKSDSIVIIVGLTGKIRGQAMFAMNKPVALEIASRMMGGMAINELDEISKSALNELANMVMGNASTILYNKGIAMEITPPSFLMGENLQISSSQMKTICIPLMLDEVRVIEIAISALE